MALLSEAALKGGDDLILLRLAEGWEQRQTDGALIIVFRDRTIAGGKAEPPVVWLGMDGNIVDIHADASLAQGLEGGGAGWAIGDLDGVEVQILCFDASPNCLQSINLSYRLSFLPARGC